MDIQLIAQNLVTPPILFFFLGMLATWLRSDLSIPQPIARLFSIYLLFSIGFHGGVELAASGLDLQVWLTLVAATLAAVLIPVWSFFVLRLRLDAYNAGAIAATYGSISAVTFITATSFLKETGLPYSGYMVAAMALMESPAIIVGVLLARVFAGNGAGAEGPAAPMAWGRLTHEAFLNGAVFLLLGSLVIGALTGERGWESVKPLAYDPFKGVLCLFLLDMGLVAAKRIRDMRSSGLFLVGFALVAPLVHALMGIALGWLLALSPGDALLLAVLCGSASYIAVPAAVRLAIPQANPSLYVPMALAVTFPFNIALGIPLYLAIINSLW